MERLILIDGNAILHRAYHAIPHLTNKQGQPTNAVYGFTAIVLRVIETLAPTHLIVTFDRPKPTFRKELYKEYQAQRPEMEEALVSQIQLVHDVVAAMGIPIFEKDGYEADDVIGTLSKQAKSVDEVIVVTGDRDLLQLVDDKVKLFMPIKGLNEGKLFGEQETEERMGVKPQQITDFKALAGDASDNYPGVDGIGPKTAVELLKKFGSVKNLYAHVNEIDKDGLRQKLIDGKEDAMLSYQLATVVRNAPVTLDLEKAKLHNDFLSPQLIELFGSFGFSSLLKRLSKMTQEKIAVEKKKEVASEKKQMELF